MGAVICAPWACETPQASAPSTRAARGIMSTRLILLYIPAALQVARLSTAQRA